MLLTQPLASWEHWNTALALIADGRYQEGWEEYEWRFVRGIVAPRLPGVFPRWKGQRLATGRLLVTCEQGHGDNIMMARFLAKAREKAGAPVVLEVYPTLARLLGHLADRAVPYPEATKALGITAQCSLMSLPYLLGIERPEDVQVQPYLRAVPKERTAERTIGLCWRGSAGHAADADRSIGWEAIRRLCDVPGVRFVSLQHDNRECILRDYPLSGDFQDTADAVAACDLVVTCDTSIAHIAGALGVPTWLLISDKPDYRWGLSGESTDWYSSVRLWRRGEGGWPQLIERVREELA